MIAHLEFILAKARVGRVRYAAVSLIEDDPADVTVYDSQSFIYARDIEINAISIAMTALNNGVQALLAEETQTNQPGPDDVQ